MPDTFNCPNCGAPLDYKGSDPIIRCPYCNSSVVVPENLRAKPSFSSQPSNYTFSGMGDMGGLINQARRFKEVKDLARAGDMDEAVRVYCEITGVSPEMARPSVEALAHGQPITLTGLNMGDLMGSVRMSPPTPAINIQPVDEKTSKGIARSLGCGIGCFVVGLVAFILITVLVPTFGGLAGIMVGLQPDLVLTAAPNIPNLPNIPGVAPVSGFGTQELSFGGEGTGPGLFGDVRAIAVNPANGKIFAANYDDGRVQVFDAEGKFQTQWIIPKEISDPYFGEMVVDRKGTVYIPVFGKIKRFDEEGKTLGEIKVNGLHIDSIALTADGSLVAVANGETILWLDKNGKVLKKVDDAVSSVSGDPELQSKVAVDGMGKVYLLGTFNNAVYVYSAEGKYLNHFGSKGEEGGQFQAPSAIDIDNVGRIFISDIKGVQVFSNDGRYIDVIKVQYFAYGLAFDDQGKLYVTTNQKKVEKYNIPE